MKISIVVPCYNEQHTIALVIEALEHLDLDTEIIVVDDGSTDESRAILASRQHAPNVRIELMPQNGGKGTALRRGFEVATGDIIVIQDSDLELSPSNIVNLIRPIETGEADVVYGSRFLMGARKTKRLRRLANWFLTELTNAIFHTDLTDMETAHKAMRASILKKIPLESKAFDIEVELTAKLARSGARMMEVASLYTPRSIDEGKKITFSDGIDAVKRILYWAKWRPEENA